MQLKFKTLCIALATVIAAQSTQAFQVQNEQPRVVQGQKENTIKGLNIDKFPVKDVTNQIYSQVGIRLGGSMIENWVGMLKQAGYDTSGYQRGLAACGAKLAGRRYILDYGNATSQVHIYNYGTADGAFKSTPQTNAPINVQNFAAGSQVNLTGLFCQVYGYEYLTQAIQIQRKSTAGYAPLCEVLQGNSCGLANDQQIQSIVRQAVLMHPCVPGMPTCN